MFLQNRHRLETTFWAQKQFIQEAQLLYQLRHPHIPRVIDYFLIPRQGQYLVMDYVPGENLEAIVRPHSALGEVEALACMAQVLDALIYLHDQAIIHRDVKPWWITRSGRPTPCSRSRGARNHRRKRRRSPCRQSARVRPSSSTCRPPRRPLLRRSPRLRRKSAIPRPRPPLSFCQSTIWPRRPSLTPCTFATHGFRVALSR